MDQPDTESGEPLMDIELRLHLPSALRGEPEGLTDLSGAGSDQDDISCWGNMAYLDSSYGCSAVDSIVLPIREILGVKV